MEIGSILLILALLLLVGLFVGRPFFDDKTDQLVSASDQGEHERSALLAERDRVLMALGELDFDNTLGKIPDGEYPIQRAALLQSGAQVLRQLDRLQPGLKSGEAEARLQAAISDPDQVSGSLDAPVHGRLAALAQSSEDDEVERLLAQRRRARQEKAAGFCPQCGKPVQHSDRFCPKCGAKRI